MEETMSKNQLVAMHILQRHGSICRYHGGYWMQPGVKKEITHKDVYVGTGTIKSLLARKIIKVTKEAESRRGKFPVECAINNPSNP